jgi:hypothetical protein
LIAAPRSRPAFNECRLHNRGKVTGVHPAQGAAASVGVVNLPRFPDRRNREQHFFKPPGRPSILQEASSMKRSSLVFSLALLAVSPGAVAQSSSLDSRLVMVESSAEGGAGQTTPSVKDVSASPRPFSQVALGGGVSTLGIQMQIATNLSRHFNLRGTGNVFNYSTNFTSDGINATAKLNLASAGASLDIYPFRLGFRLSPGVLFYNQNQLTAGAAVAGGSSFTLNGTTYYSASANSATGATPVNGNAALGLNTTKPAFTITAGWGNMIPRTHHWSFPFEAGVAVIGAPTVNVNLGGWACYDQAQTECANIAGATNPIAIAIQSNLAAQVAKWTTDLNPLKTYPILSFGVAYSFHVR